MKIPSTRGCPQYSSDGCCRVIPPSDRVWHPSDCSSPCGQSLNPTKASIQNTLVSIGWDVVLSMFMVAMEGSVAVHKSLLRGNGDVEECLLFGAMGEV